MSISVKQQFTEFNSLQAVALKRTMGGVQQDLAALHGAVTGLTAKLDADSGVNDTDYAATLDPAAQQVQS